MIPDPPIFAHPILAQVVKLLKAEETEKLLQILRSRIFELSEMDDETVAGPDGLAHVHRLTSEAGMLGFPRLSTICSILDDGPQHCSAEQMAWARAELHPTLERSHQEIARQLDGALRGGDHGLAS
jgi:HPt (histidine-containing phosphotransfer) domain-containing protein